MSRKPQAQASSVSSTAVDRAAPAPLASPQQPRGTAGLARDHLTPTTRGTPGVPRRPGPGHWKGSGALTGWSDASSPGCVPGSSPAAGKAHGRLRTRRVGWAERSPRPPPTGQALGAYTARKEAHTEPECVSVRGHGLGDTESLAACPGWGLSGPGRRRRAPGTSQRTSELAP